MLTEGGVGGGGSCTPGVQSRAVACPTASRAPSPVPRNGGKRHSFACCQLCEGLFEGGKEVDHVKAVDPAASPQSSLTSSPPADFRPPSHRQGETRASDPPASAGASSRSRTTRCCRLARTGRIDTRTATRASTTSPESSANAGEDSSASKYFALIKAFSAKLLQFPGVRESSGSRAESRNRDRDL
jgi:hypothetical protein